jgi:hypothetical protein
MTLSGHWLAYEATVAGTCFPQYGQHMKSRLIARPHCEHTGAMA